MIHPYAKAQKSCEDFGGASIQYLWVWLDLAGVARSLKPVSAMCFLCILPAPSRLPHGLDLLLYAPSLLCRSPLLLFRYSFQPLLIQTLSLNPCKFRQAHPLSLYRMPIQRLENRDKPYICGSKPMRVTHTYMTRGVRTVQLSQQNESLIAETHVRPCLLRLLSFDD